MINVKRIHENTKVEQHKADLTDFNESIRGFFSSSAYNGFELQTRDEFSVSSILDSEDGVLVKFTYLCTARSGEYSVLFKFNSELELIITPFDKPIIQANGKLCTPSVKLLKNTLKDFIIEYENIAINPIDRDDEDFNLIFKEEYGYRVHLASDKEKTLYNIICVVFMYDLLMTLVPDNLIRSMHL